MMKNAGDFADSFIEFEKENALFGQKLEGVFFWKLVRSRVYNNILKAKGILGAGSFTVAESLGGKARDFMRYCSAALINVFRPYPRADVVVVTHPRKVTVNGKKVDVNTAWLIDRLREQKARYLVLDVPLNWGTHPMQIDKNTRKIENFTIIPKVFYKFFVRNYLRRPEKLKELSARLTERFGHDGNIVKEAHDQIKIFKIDYKHYSRLLKKIRPKKIWLVIGYGNHALIAAAKDQGIETEEIQHGLMSRHHMNYSFGGLKDIPYFPDRICLFGSFWYDISNLPLTEDRVDYYNNPIVGYERGGVRNPKNKKILFLTQPIITRYIEKLVAEMMENRFFDEYEIAVKLHPAEYRVWKRESPGLAGLTERGVRIIDNSDVPLYDLFREYDTVVAVASTALFEALYFGCDVYLLSVPSIRWIDSLAGERFPSPIRTVDDLVNLLTMEERNNIDIGEVFYDGDVAVDAEVTKNG